MSKIIDILVVIDAETLATSRPGGTPAQPQNLGYDGQSDVYIFMIAKRSYATGAEGGSELTVHADSGDTVRWSVSSPDAGINYSLILHNFSATQHAEAIGTPVMSEISFNEYQPVDLSKPTGQLQAVPRHNFVWTVEVLSPGVTVRYNWEFSIVDRAGKVLGCYLWDPYITIS